jgi:ATP-binding cassette subfamily B multidrug efflux pump
MSASGNEQERQQTQQGTGSAPAANRPTDPKACAKRLWEAARGQRWRVVVAILSAVMYVLFTVWAVAYSAGLVDLLWEGIKRAFETGTPYQLDLTDGGMQLLIYGALWTGAWAFYSVQSLVMSSFAERLNLQLRKQISAKLGRLPLRYFDSRQPGDTISRATNDLDKVSQAMQRGLLQLIIAATMLLGCAVCMLMYSVPLTLAFVAFSLAGAAITYFVSHRTLDAVARRQAVLGRLTSEVEESYSGRAVVKAFGLEGKTLERVGADADEFVCESAHADFLTNAVGPMVRFVMRLAQVCIGLGAGALVISGGMSVGVFQAYFQYMAEASGPMTELSLSYNMLQGALAAAERVFAFLDEEEVSADPEHPIAPAEPVRGRVCFEHVRFGYDPAHPLMRDVSFVAEPGQKVAIVGQTGAGKTTLVNLLMRFYEIDGGRITLDGVDTRHMTRQALRHEFGMVLQDTWLFEGTVAENIAYGRLGATREEVEAAARAAHVDFFIRTLPHGYDTMLTSDAEGVSQGQRQLLTIARAMLADPAILILDEATSSVDTRTEQAIVRAMEAIMENRTSFVIAHRLSTIVDADLILVMDHGNIIEKGTHEELLAAGGAYAELYRSQFA